MELSTTTTISTADVQAAIAQAKYDPTSVIKASLDIVDQLTNGAAGTVDPTNPFILLTEMGAVLASTGIQEAMALHRRIYPALSSTEDDLYTHMSDVDYLNRFASPAYNKFFFALELNGLMENLVRDGSESCDKAIIPRNTTITIDGYVFTLLYPVVIRRYDNGSVQITFDTSIADPIHSPETLVIPYALSTDADNNKILLFEVEMAQVAILSSEHTSEMSSSFKKTIPITDSFCFIRAFHQNDTSGVWKEIETTHTALVFDPNTPTMLAKLVDSGVEVFIPSIYQNKGLIGKQIRIDIYTTKGAVDFAANSYKLDQVEVAMRPIDEVRDVSVYSNALSQVSIYAGCQTKVTGGKSNISYTDLRNRVIYNANGPQEIPITPVDLVVNGQNNGFDIVKNIDVLTNRVLLATRKLPTPSNSKILTPANIGVVTFHANLTNLSSYSDVVSNGDRVTILSNALYRSVNGQVSLMNSTDIMGLYALNQTTMVAMINENQYFYSPFYYVLDDTGNEFDLRAYDLDSPVASAKNFIKMNQSLQLAVNTGSYGFAKTQSGYKLTIVTTSGNFFKQIPNDQVGVQLAFYPPGENTLAYINGELDHSATAARANTDQECVYVFNIESNHDLDSNDRICITNAEVDGVTDYKAFIDLGTQFHLLYWTNSITDNFTADDTDQMLGKFLLPSGAAGNVHETLQLSFGTALSNLWRRSRSYLTGITYKTYTVDIPATYSEDVYQVDENGSTIQIVDGQVVRTLLHAKGDIIHYSDGSIVYKHRAGDVVLDASGNPIPATTAASNKDIDILVVDGRYYFATDAVTASYRSEIAATLVDWITDGLSTISDHLLEQTHIYFYPKTTLGTVQVYTENNGQDYLPAEQSFVVDLYVPKSVYDNAATRLSIENATVKLLDTAVSQTVVNMSDVTEQLRTLYGSLVNAFKISGLGGAKDYRVVTVASEQNKLCLLKELTALSDGTLTVSDAVKINFNVI